MNFTGKRQETDVKETKPKFESVANYMARDVITFSPHQPIIEAIDIMLEHRISGGPVLNERGDLVGMLSEKDCLRIIVDRAYHNHPNQKGRVDEFMSRDVVTVDISKDVVDVANLFLSSNFRRFPVVDNRKLMGQVSRRDIMRAARKLKGSTW